MAKKLGVSVNGITRLEKGELPPNLGIEIVFNIWEEFHITPNEQLSQWLEE